jgi:hypothetical protein
MPVARAVSPPLNGSWRRAVAARETSLIRTRATADRVADRRSCLDRAIPLLNESEPRVARSRRRRVVLDAERCRSIAGRTVP